MVERGETKKPKISFDLGYMMGSELTGGQKDRVAHLFFAYIFGAEEESVRKVYPQVENYPSGPTSLGFRRFWEVLKEEFPGFVPQNAVSEYTSKFFPLRVWRNRFGFENAKSFILGMYEGQSSWEKLDECGLEESHGEFEGVPLTEWKSKDLAWSKLLEHLTFELAFMQI